MCFERELHDLVPEPFLYNAVKHHRDFVMSTIDKLKSCQNDRAHMLEVLNKTGRQVIDFYLGTLSPFEVAEELRLKMVEMNIFNEDAYHSWLQKIEKKFRNIEVSDGSTWILLWGRIKGRYIHIHPARSSRHSVRVRALALKTAILLRIFEEDYEYNLIEKINHWRKDFLGESPIKDDSDTVHIRRVLEVLAW